MANGAQRFMKFYPSDWRAEPRLRMVSRAARSLWIDILGLIHDGGSHRLEIDGRPMTEREIAAALGDNPRTIRKLMKELSEAGIYSFEGSFVISRRVKRDRTKLERDRNNGRTGGNPALLSKGYDPQGVNPPLKAKPEARSQKPEERAYALPSKGAPERAGGTGSPDQFDDLWARCLTIAGHDRRGVIPSGWMPPAARLHVARWQTDLGLSVDEIVETATACAARFIDDPPSSPKAWDHAMKRTAAAAAAPQMTIPKGPTDARSAASQSFDDALAEAERGLREGTLTSLVAGQFAPGASRGR